MCAVFFISFLILREKKNMEKRKKERKKARNENPI